MLVARLAEPTLVVYLTAKLDVLMTRTERHGRKYDTNELTQRVTGEEINSGPYIQYLTDKFSEIYGL